MKVIRHRNCSDRTPIFVCATECLDCFERCWISKDRPAFLDAQRDEISDGLVLSKPDRDSRWTRHSFDCRGAILAAKKKRRRAKIAALQFQYPKAFLRSAAVGSGSLRTVIASAPESFS